MDTQRYHIVARWLHWGIALLILCNLLSGFFGEALKDLTFIPAHKAVGLTVLVLSVLRVIWRLVYKSPPLPSSLTDFEVFTSHFVHALLYILMLAMPLTGWVIASSGKWPLTWFGLFDWPKLPVIKGSPVAEAAHNLHGIGGWVFVILILGHVGAALRHQFVLKDGLIRRML